MASNGGKKIMRLSKTKVLSILVIGLFIGVIISENVFNANVKADLGDVIYSFDCPGTGPTGLTWDGTFLWHADWNDNTIYKINPSNGNVVDSFNPGIIWPWGLAWDGNHLWVVGRAYDMCYKLDPSDGTILDSFHLPEDLNSQGLTWDGAYLWFSGYESSAEFYPIYKLDPTDGSVVDSFIMDFYASDLAWDGDYLWLVGGGGIYKFDPSDGTLLTVFDPPGGARGLTWDGAYLWIACVNDCKIYQVDVVESVNNEWDIQIVDSAGAYGSLHYNSIAVDSNNRPHISYKDCENDDLKYAYWTGSEWDIQTVDSDGDVGRENSIAVDSNNRPHISYYDEDNDDLKYAYWTGSEWDIQTVDSLGFYVQEESSIALDSNDNPHIVYIDFDLGDVKYAYWTGSDWDIQTVSDSSSFSIGGECSMDLDSNDRAHICFIEYSNDPSTTIYRYAYWTGSEWDIQTVESYIGTKSGHSHIKLDSNNRPHISLLEPTLENVIYAYWTSSEWDIQTVDSDGRFFYVVSIDVDLNNRPHIGYYDFEGGDLKYAYWNGSDWDLRTVDYNGNLGNRHSIAVDSNNRPHISYTDTSLKNLKYAKKTGGNQPPGFSCHEITYESYRTIQNKGTYTTYYQCNKPTAIITINDPDNYLQITQPNSQGIFSTHVDTSQITIDPDDLPIDLEIQPESVSVTFDGNTYDLYRGLFTYTLHIEPREYNTYWDLKGSSGIGVGIIAFAKADAHGKFTLRYDIDNILRLQRYMDYDQEVGLTGSLFELESSIGDAKFVSGAVSSIFTLLRESGMKLDFNNPSETQKAVMALYFLIALASFIGGNVLQSPVIGNIANWLFVTLSNANILDLKEYDGTGVGSSGEAGGYLLDSSLGPSQDTIHMNVVDIDAGVSGEIGGLYSIRDYESYDKHTFLMFLKWFYGLNENILGNDNIIFGDDDYVVSSIEIDDYGSDYAHGTYHFLRDKREFTSLDTKEVIYDLGNIKDTDIYRGTIDKINTPWDIYFNAVDWTESIEEEKNDCTFMVNKKYGTDLSVPIDVEITVADVKVYFNYGIGFEQANVFTEESGIRKNGVEFITASYDDDITVETIQLQTLITQLFSINIFNLLSNLFYFIGQQFIDVTDDAYEFTTDVIDKNGGIVATAVKAVICPGAVIIDYLTKGRSNDSHQTNMTVLVHNLSYINNNSLNGFQSTHGMNSSYYSIMNGINIAVTGVVEFQPFNMSISPPALLQFNYTDEHVNEIDENLLQIYQWQIDSHVWKPLLSIVNISSNQVYANMGRFGTYLLGYDQQLPIINYHNLSPIYKDQVHFQATVFDNQSGINVSTINVTMDGQPINYSYTLNTGILEVNTNASAGSHTFSITAKDMNNNTAINSTILQVTQLSKISNISWIIYPMQNSINISWNSINGTYPVVYYTILMNNTFINTTDNWLNHTLNHTMYYIYPVDAMDYHGYGEFVILRKPIASFSYWDKGLNSIEFNASRSYDADGTITSMLWDLGDGNISSDITFIHQYQQEDTYNVSLTVWDNDGFNTTLSRNVIVENIVPVVNFTYYPNQPTTINTVQFNDSSYDLDGFIYNWSWDFGDGNVSNLQNPTYQYMDDGLYTVTLTVIDSENKANNISKIINVSNVGPVANFTWTPPNPTTHDTIVFNDTSIDYDGFPVNWTWDLGDGNISFEQNPIHIFTIAGNFTVCLNVTDDDGASDEICKQLTVIEILGDINQSTWDRGFPIRHALDGDWGAAQSFTPTLDTLTSAEIYMRKFGTPEFNLTVELRTDHPQGTLIDTLIFTPSEVPSSWDWFTLDFNDVTVTPGTDYFIVCPPAPSGVTTSFGYEWGYAFGNQYDDGSFWFTRDGGGLWRDLPTMYEFAFLVYGYS